MAWASGRPSLPSGRSLSERSKIYAEVTGRLTESLGGVRVVKGYHAEDREARVFSAGVARLLDNVIKSLNAMSLMSLSATVLMGIVGAIMMFVGARQIFAGALTLGEFVTFTAFLAFLVAPVFQIVGIGTQITEALADSTARTRYCASVPKTRTRARTVDLARFAARLFSRTSVSHTRRASRCCTT